MYNRYEALDVEDQSMDAVHDGSFTPEVLPRSEALLPNHNYIHKIKKANYNCM